MQGIWLIVKLKTIQQQNNGRMNMLLKEVNFGEVKLALASSPSLSAAFSLQLCYIV